MENSDFPRFRDYIRKQLPAWKDLKDDEFDFFLFSSLTNKVYKVTAKQSQVTPNAIILRHFCGLEGIVDKDKEIKVFAEMSKSGFGPQCYGNEGDVRLEEYISSRTIHPHEYKERLMRRKLARTLAAIHKLHVNDVNKIALTEEHLDDPKFFKSFDDKCEQDIFTPEEKKVIQELKNISSKSEQDFVRSIIPRDEIVFSHNDLLQGNILISNENEDVVFIDYEYAAYNFRGYDIGNMYKEATFDYGVKTPPYFQIVDSNFPNDEELREFLRYYIVFTDMKVVEKGDKTDNLINNDEEMKTYLETNYKPEELKARENKLVRETMIGVMLSYHFWLIWAIKMHKTVDTQFDYLEFARSSHEKYLKFKKDLFNL